MCIRQGLLAFVAVLAGMASVQAMPPQNPQVEGREPNPVVREFYGTESDQFEYAGEESAEPLAAGWWGSRAALGALFNKLTMPLGPMELWD
jgi:hypothetical protein